jgi:hypothetical protein
MYTWCCEAYFCLLDVLNLSLGLAAGHPHLGVAIELHRRHVCDEEFSKLVQLAARQSLTVCPLKDHGLEQSVHNLRTLFWQFFVYQYHNDRIM